MWSDAEVREAISPAMAVAAVRAACADLRAGSFELPVRTALAGGSQLVMPVHHRPTATSMTKIVNLVGDIDGLIVWTDAAGSSAPLVSAGALTELRTAAVTALAVDVMAAPTASRLVVFGTGVQARAHVAALGMVRRLSSVEIISRDVTRAQRFAASLPCDARAGSLASLESADLVCCATRAEEPLFDYEQLGPRVHVSAVGSHRAQARELPRDLMAKAQEVVVDDLGACLLEAGELIDAIEAGVLAAEAVTALPDRLLHASSPGQTVFKSVGIAAFDWALAMLLVESCDRPVKPHLPW